MIAHFTPWRDSETRLGKEPCLCLCYEFVITSVDLMQGYQRTHRTLEL